MSYGEHFLPEIPTASQTRLAGTSFALPRCVPKTLDKPCCRGPLQRASPGCPACNVSLVSSSYLLAPARRNSIGAGETSGERRSLMTQGSTNLPRCSLTKCTQQPELLQWYFSYRALLSCKEACAMRIYIREAFHSSVSSLQPL